MPKESVYYMIGNLNGKHDAGLVKKQLDELPGVLSVSVNVEDARLAVDFDNTGVNEGKIVGRLRELGYEITSDNSQNHMI